MPDNELDNLEAIFGEDPTSEEDDHPLDEGIDNGSISEPSDEDIEETVDDLEDELEEAMNMGDGANPSSSPSDEVELPSDEDLLGTSQTPDTGPVLDDVDADEANRWMNSDKVSEREGSELLEVKKEMEELEKAKSQIGFSQAENIRGLIEAEAWEIDNYPSFRKWVASPDFEVSKSAAYRYRRVSQFMDEAPIGDEDFDEQFYEDFGIDKDVVRDSSGEIDEKKTREANNLKRRLNFTDTHQVARLYESGDINFADAKELLAKSIEQDADAFSEELQKHKEGRDSTISEELQDRGLAGPAFVINARNREEAQEKLEELHRRLEEGEDFVGPVVDGDAEKIGSKSVKFVEMSDGTLLGDV